VLLILGAVIVVKGGSFGTSGLSLEPLTPQRWFRGRYRSPCCSCFASFVRFEATAIYSEEAKDERTVPRAAFLAVIVIGAVYMRRRRICHCDASFRPQLGRARISPSWKGWAQRSPESATSSDDQSVAGTVRPATNTDRISFLDRRERSVPQPQPRWAGVHPQAGDATGLEMRSVSTEFVALLDRDHCARTTPTRPTGWRNDSPPASAAG
jgi:hypothetical protein